MPPFEDRFIPKSLSRALASSAIGVLSQTQSDAGHSLFQEQYYLQLVAEIKNEIRKSTGEIRASQFRPPLPT